MSSNMHPQTSQEILQANLEQIRELLEKQRVVEMMVHSQASPKHDLVESLVHRQHLVELQNRLGRLHTADVAYILDTLPPKDRLIIWYQVRHRRGGEILLEVSDAVRRQLIESTSAEDLLKILKQLDADDLTYIAEDLPADILQQCMQSLSAEDRTWLQSSMTYPEDAVGHYMSNIMVSVREDEALEQVLEHLRGLHELPNHTDKLFVFDRRGIFKGVLPVQTLLLSQGNAKVIDVMATDVVKFLANDDAGDAAQAFERYDLVSAPVVNERGKLVGRLTVDVMMDYVREKSSDELLKLAGLNKEEDPFLTIWNSARNRWLWLSMNIVTAFVASRVIGLFEHSIAHLVALAALMPIVASVGGNTGNQTTALVIRAISMGQLTPSNILQFIRKELGISLLNGSLFGIVVGLSAFMLYSNFALGMVLAGALLLNLIIAAGVGLAAPILLDHYGRDRLPRLKRLCN